MRSVSDGRARRISRAARAAACARVAARGSGQRSGCGSTRRRVAEDCAERSAAERGTSAKLRYSRGRSGAVACRRALSPSAGGAAAARRGGRGHLRSAAIHPKWGAPPRVAPRRARRRIACPGVPPARREPAHGKALHGCARAAAAQQAPGPRSEAGPQGAGRGGAGRCHEASLPGLKGSEDVSCGLSRK
jgi:hypothetical protein